MSTAEETCEESPLSQRSPTVVKIESNPTIFSGASVYSLPSFSSETSSPPPPPRPSRPGGAQLHRLGTEPAVSKGRTSVRRIFQALSFNFGGRLERGTRNDSSNGDDGNDDAGSGSTKLEEKVFSMPAFKLRHFQRANSQSTDIIVLYTNAVRHESRVLYTILYCLHERCNELHLGDIQSFFVWLGDYHIFFCTFISLVNDVLLPALRDLIPFRHYTPQYFADEGQRLNRIVDKTLRAANLFTNRYSTSQATDKLSDIYSHFSQPLLWYLFSLEKYCSVIITRFSTHEDTQSISLTMATALKNKDHFKRTLPLLLRCLEHRPQTTFAWLRQHYHFHTIRLYRFWMRPTEHEKTYEYFKLVSKTQFAE